MESNPLIPEIKRIRFLNVPIDILPPEQFGQSIIELLEDPKFNQILLIDIYDVLWAQFNYEYRRSLENAALVIPVSKSIVWGIRFLRKKIPFRYMPFHFIIKLLGVLEKKQKSVYLLGSSKANVQKAESNLRASFPGLNFVGRYVGYFNKVMERNIVLSVKKSSPTLLLASKGLVGKEKWLYRKRYKLGNCICLWDQDVFDIFAGSKKRIPDHIFKRGTYFFTESLKKPWKILNSLIMFVYFLYLVFWRVFVRK